MTILPRIAWILVLTTSLATILLVPRGFDYLYPADATGQILISGTGVAASNLEALATKHGVEVGKVLVRADVAVVPGKNETTYTTQIVSSLGESHREGSQQFGHSFFLPGSLVYESATPRGDALGRWIVIGSDESVAAFVSDATSIWGQAITSSSVLRTGDAVREALSSPLGRSLVLAELTLTLVIVITITSRPAAFRSSLLAGRSRSRMLLHELRTTAVSSVLWVLLPLGALAATVYVDRTNASTLLTVNRMVTELLAAAGVLTILATIIGACGGLAVLALTSRGRTMGRPTPSRRTRTVLAAGTTAAALLLVWSYASSSTAVSLDVANDRASRDQAQAQEELPAAYALAFWNLSEPTFSSLSSDISSFAHEAEATSSLVIAWTVPDDTTPDASGPPTIFLNNAAAASYGLPTVSPSEMVVYRPGVIASQDGALRTLMADNAALQRHFGSTLTEPSISIRDQADAIARLPATLPRATYSLSGTQVTSQDCLIVVIPDGYLAATNLLAAMTQGGAVISSAQGDPLETLTMNGLGSAISRIDAVGVDHTATVHSTTERLILDSLVLLVSGGAAVIAMGLSARSWTRVSASQREMDALLGRRSNARLVVGLSAAALLLLVLPLLNDTTPFLAACEAVCALGVLGAIVIGGQASLVRSRPGRRHISV